MCSYEELALMAKEGDSEAIAQLWERTFGFMYYKVKRYFPLCERAGITREDLMQEVFFALKKAVRTFDPERGSFLSLLAILVNSVACSAIKYKKGAFLPTVVSIDEPLPGTENYTLSDTLVDEAAEAEIYATIDNWHWDELRDYLEECLHHLKPKEEYVVRARFYHNKKLKEISGEMGINENRVGILSMQALQKLSHPRFSRKLLQFYRAI